MLTASLPLFLDDVFLFIDDRFLILEWLPLFPRGCKASQTASGVWQHMLSPWTSPFMLYPMRYHVLYLQGRHIFGNINKSYHYSQTYKSTSRANSYANDNNKSQNMRKKTMLETENKEIGTKQRWGRIWSWKVRYHFTRKSGIKI